MYCIHLNEVDLTMWKNKTLLFITHFLLTMTLVCCKSNDENKQTGSTKPTDYIKPIRGDDDSISLEDVEKGKVLIGYADCHICHKDDKRAVGPAFQDIAKRYPVNEAYIKYLAQKVIAGGSGSWGYPVMTPHPKLSLENAKLMVTYILSLDSNQSKR